MMGPRRVFLDPHRDNAAPADHVVVADPVSFVLHALGDQPLFVQGVDLCRWVEDFGVGRSWTMIRLASPTQELLQQCPDLTHAEVTDLVARLSRQVEALERPIQLRQVVATLWADLPLTDEEPTADHAFAWLAWLAQHEDGRFEFKLVWPLARNWEARAAPQLRRAYGARSATEAWSVLREWLGVLRGAQEWPYVPQRPLEHWLLERLDHDLRGLAIETDTDFFVGLLRQAVDKRVVNRAAQACAKVLMAHPDMTTNQRVQRLRLYLPHDQWMKLVTLFPPDYPGLPSWQFDQLSSWFRQKYLPYRKWVLEQNAMPAGPDWVTESAPEFARQYLEYFVSARTGGEGAEHLAWVKSTNLRGRTNGPIIVLVILDGLTHPDAERLCTWLEEASSRLALDRATLAMAPLPTVTEFAKPAIAQGASPAQAIQDASGAVYSSAEQVTEQLGNAAAGKVLVWALVEPDRTYHFRADAGPSTVRREVDAQLISLARQIALVIEQAPAEKQVRLIITTDHGRLLAHAKRTKGIPTGMKAHGRAAWGRRDMAFDRSGIRLDDDLAFLHPLRFGLPPDQAYAIIVSAEAFVTADGRGGIEPFPHGGLFPEEVLIPWLEFTRDRAPINVLAFLRGNGQEGKPGSASLDVQNRNEVAFRVVGLQLDEPEAYVDLDVEVPALSQPSIAVLLPAWPNKQQIQHLVATLQYELPDGSLSEAACRVELRSESLYERADLLRELGDL